jgi:hypothetical protein
VQTIERAGEDPRHNRERAVQEPHQDALGWQPEHEFDRHNGGKPLDNAIPAFFSQPACAPPRTKPKVRTIQDAAIRVFEMPEQQRQANGQVGDTRRGEEDPPVLLQHTSAVLQQQFGPGQVFQYVQEKNLVECSSLRSVRPIGQAAAQVEANTGVQDGPALEFWNRIDAASRRKARMCHPTKLEKSKSSCQA